MYVYVYVCVFAGVGGWWGGCGCGFSRTVSGHVGCKSLRSCLAMGRVWVWLDEWPVLMARAQMVECLGVVKERFSLG